MQTKKLSFAEIQLFRDEQLAFISQLAKEYGGIVHVKMLWFDLIFVNEPDLIRELLIKQSNHLHKDQFAGAVFRRVLGNGVFSAEGKQWKKQRKMVQPAFHAQRIQEYTNVMAEYTREMVAGWRPGDTRPIDVDLTRLTLRIIAKTIYNVDIQSKTAEIGRLMREITETAEAQLKMAFVPPKWLPTKVNRRQNRALQAVRGLLLEIIEERRVSGRDEGDLLSMLLSARDEDGNPMPDEQLLDECITLFFAGHDTTAATLMWCWALLGQNPFVAQQLIAELDSVLGDDPITFEQLANLPYLEAVVKESMRLYPPAFGIARQVIEPFTIGEHTFPKGATVIFNIFVTHRRTDLYDEPEVFKPERWLDGDDPGRYAYLPFGAGPRICLGNMFSLLEARVILATILQHYSLNLTPETQIIRDTQVTLRPRAPLFMQVTSR